MSRCHRVLGLIAGGVLLTVIGGCGDDGGPSQAPCTSGTRRDCVTADKKVGEETCQGGVWGDCVATGECTDGSYRECTLTDQSKGKQKCADQAWGECLRCQEGEKQSCSTKCGTGTEVCVKGDWANCDAPKEAQEVCDGADNNCDGNVDEVCSCAHGKTEACYSGPAATRNKGQCKDGQRVCDKGSWGDCKSEVLPAAKEECTDQIDNDCDGVVNNGCTCTPGKSQDCGKNVGECKYGTQTCSGTADWGPCLGAVGPFVEKDTPCDGKDNDCDGIVDNNLDPDKYESNNTCATARPVTASDIDENPATVEATIYPEGDVDYIKVTAKEEGPDLGCVAWPIPPESNYLDVQIISPSVTGISYQAEIMNTACTSSIKTTTKTATVYWDGQCGLTDSRDIYIKVSATQSSKPTFSCKPYKLAVLYTNIVGCTNVPCTGASDPICTSKGCGACDSKGYCTAKK